MQWVETCLAIARAGAVSVPISYDATEPEIAYRLADANCRAIVTTAERGDLVARLQGERAEPCDRDRPRSRRGAAQRYEHAGLRRSRNRRRAIPRECTTPAFILYTSGTTGRAKGVLLTVHGMLWIVAACWAPIAGLSERDTVLSPLPLFHSYALNLSVLGDARDRRERIHHGEVLDQRGGAAAADRRIHLFPRRADDVSLSVAGDARGEGHRLSQPAALHLGRRHHAGDAQSRVRGALRRAAARRLRHHRDLHHGDDELADRRARARLVRLPGAGPRRAHRRSGARGATSRRARRAS